VKMFQRLGLGRYGSLPLLSMAIVLGATVAGTAGCAAARNGLGTSSEVCFEAIPVGKAALGKPAPILVPPPTTPVPKTTAKTPVSTTRPTEPLPTLTKPGPNPNFVGVRSASLKDIAQFGEKHGTVESQLEKSNGGPIKGLCLVAFKGSFDPQSVHDLIGKIPPEGQRIYAIAVVSEPSNKLLAVLLRSREPISFTHYSAG
jgi:hypothetical protein